MKCEEHDLITFQTLTFSKTPDGNIFIDERGTSITEFSPQKGVVHLMHALGCRAMFKRDGTAVITGQPGNGQPGYGQPAYGHHGYYQPAQPGVGGPSAPFASFNGNDGMQQPPGYNESKEKF